MSRDKGKNIFITCMSIVLMLVIMGESVVAAENNSITYGYVNEEKTQVEASIYIPSDYAEWYYDHLTIGKTLISNGMEYAILGIGSGVFSDAKLCSVIIKDRDNSFYIGNKAFENVSVLNPLAQEGGGSITISCDVETIGDYAFSNAVVSNNIYIEGDVGKIGAYAFEEVKVPGTFLLDGNIDTIGKYSFKNAGKVIVNKFREAQEGAFYGTTISALNAIEGMEILGDSAFENCICLESVKLADSVTSIGANCFKGCTSLESITLPANSLLTIGENAFPNQEGLVIVIPSEITNISNYHFDTLTNVVFQIDIDCSSTVIQYFEDNGIQYKKGSNDEVIKGDGDDTSNDNEDDDANSGESEKTENNIQSGDENQNTSSGNTDNNGASNNSGATEDTNKDDAVNTGTTTNPTQPSVEKLEKGKTYIYKNMRYKVTGSSTVTFMKPINKKVKKITIPAKVTILGKKFKVTKINKKACYKCKKLETVSIGNNVTTIGDQAFAKCAKLKKVTIGKGVTTIGKKAFAYDEALQKVKIRSKKIKTIKKSAFKGVNDKKVSITAPDEKTAKRYDKIVNKASLWK